MEFEFDKEIDSLLRQAARSETFVSTKFDAHLDADEISAFAENALPGKARLNAMEHLAECMRCRKILSDVISYNSDAASEIIHAGGENKTVVSVPPVPWYRSLFAFPNLAFTMGALALVFSGVIGYVVIQSIGSNNTAMVSQADAPYAEKPSSAKGASSEGGSDYQGDSNLNKAATNSAPSSSSAANTTAAYPASNATANKASGPPPMEPSSSSNTGPSLDASKSLSDKPVSITEESQPTPAATPMPMAKGAPAPAPRKEDSPPPALGGAINNEKLKAKTTDIRDEDEVAKTPKDAKNAGERNDDGVTRNTTQQLPNQSRSQTTYPDTNNGQRANTIQSNDREGYDNRGRQVNQPQKKAESVAENKAVESKTVGNKTFQNRGGVWTDTAYKGGGLKTVTRNSDKYQKLDAELRRIADNFGGTVIVVWKNKNYKIQ